MSWLLAALLLAALIESRRRLRLVARAEHELRGGLTSVALGLEGGASIASVRADFERARMGLADLAAARAGRRPKPSTEPLRLDRLVWRAAAGWDLTARRSGGSVKLDWEAGPITVRADRGRLSQALGNLLSNAVEHGGARVLVTGRRSKRGVRIEVRDSGRGHGLGIAKRAVGEAGGSLSAEAAGAGRAYAIDLPIEPDGRPLREAGSAEPLASPLSPDSPAAA